MLGATIFMILILESPIVRAEDPITNLPWIDNPGGEEGNGDGRKITCSWHANCVTGTSGKAIDFRARPNATFPVIAAGNGTVQFSGPEPNGGSEGEYIVIDHGDRSTEYLHLNTRFAREGMPMCRYVTIGYAGNSGGVDPHIHFGTREDPLFPPIFGERPDEHEEPFFNSTSNIAHHTCDGSCSDETDAYTVDDRQNTSRCQSCTLDEFLESGSWSVEREGGFGYFTRRDGSYRWSRLKGTQQSPNPPTRTVVFQPNLQITDDEWAVFVLIPVHLEDGNTHRRDVAEGVKYTTRYFSSATSGESVTISTVNQRDRGGEWVRLGGASATFPTFWTPSSPPFGKPQFPLTVEMDNEHVGACAGSNCANKIVMADAAVFIPSTCAQ